MSPVLVPLSVGEQSIQHGRSRQRAAAFSVILCVHPSIVHADVLIASLDEQAEKFTADLRMLLLRMWCTTLFGNSTYSQAQIKIADNVPGSTDRIVTVSGTPEAVQLAHYLIQQR